jgi:hypothetical protein
MLLGVPTVRDITRHGLNTNCMLKYMTPDTWSILLCVALSAREPVLSQGLQPLFPSAEAIAGSGLF